MSTDSGIPDYRGADGTRRVSPMRHDEFVSSSANRRRYWARSFLGWLRFSGAAPNAAHRALTSLQGAGALGAVITQNVDGLHQAAGTQGVVELHGSLAKVVCLTCGDQTARDDVQARMAAANPGFAAHPWGAVPGGSRVSSQIRPDGDVVVPDDVVEDFRLPTCLVCGADALKPDVVFFGGSVPRDRVDACYALVEAAPALLVLGSSLAVMSGLRFVRRAARRGIPVFGITRGPTRGDDLMTARVDASLAPTLAELVRTQVIA
jgi:NAD-dependent SIR2 family protein deacetylase